MAQPMRVVQAAIHVHAATRVGDMRTVAGQQHAATAVARGDALADTIDVGRCDRQVGLKRQEIAQQRLDESRVQRPIIVDRHGQTDDHAPHLGHCQQADRIRAVLQVGDAGQLRNHAPEVERRHHAQHTLFVVLALEGYAGRLAHAAVGAVGADQPWRPQTFDAAAGSDRYLDMVALVGRCQQFRAEAHAAARMAREFAHQHRREPALFEV